MPVPPLPNELVTLIFEHLFRILSVHPAEEFLDVPLNAPFVFLPFTLVSKTWHALACPFLYRHLTTAQLIPLSQRIPAPLLQYQTESLYWNWSDSGTLPSGVVRFDGWFESVAEHVITARCSGCKRERPAAKVDFLFCRSGKTHNFPALTRLCLDYSYGQFPPSGADTILDTLAVCAPNIEHLTLIGLYRLESDRYAPWDHSPRPFSKLRILELRDFYLLDVQCLDSAVAQQLIRPHRTTLEHLSLDLDIDGVSPSFTAVLPFSLPRLRHFSCTRPATGAQTVDLPALLPSLTALTLPLPDISASLPSLPPALHRLCILSIHPENFTSVVQQVTSSLTSSGQRALSAVRVLAFDTHQERTPDPLSTAQETLRRLVDVCNTRGMTLQSNILLDVLTEEQDHPERFLQLGRTKFRGLEGLSSRRFEDEDEDERASHVWLEGDYDPVAAEEDEASSAEEEEEELDWDAEEDVQFKELWTDDKRRAWDLSQALGTCNLDSP